MVMIFFTKTINVSVIIQRRGQYGNPADYFSKKLWDDFENGFGNHTEGEQMDYN